MQWLCEQRIPLVALNWQGEVVTCIGGDSLSADFGLRQLQLAAQSNGVGLKLAIQLIQLKIAASKSTLDIFPDSKLKKRTLEKIDRCLEELTGPVPDVEALRMIEARAFDAWQSLPMRWKGTGRHPIPMDWLMVGGRQSLVSGTNRNATHPANALLNYVYGILESQIRIATTSTGFDPAIGYLHASRPGRVALVYDLMEPLRPLVDRVTLELLRMNTFTPSDFILNTKGVCRLNPEMARRLAAIGVSEAKVQSVIRWAREEIVSLSDQEPDG